MLARLLALWLALSPALAFAQSAVLNGFPPGTFQSRAAIDAPVSAGYVGPGDIVTWKWWGGLRAYSAAYASAHGNAIDIVDSSGLNPATITVLSSGDLDYATLATWVSAHGVPSIKKLYDQTGSGFNAPQSTVANMPIFVLSPSGITSGRGAMKFTTASIIGPSPSSLALSTPWTASAVYEVTTFGASKGIMGDTVFNGFLEGASANTVQLYAGTLNALVATATDNTFNAVQGLANGASSFLMVNGTPSSTANPGSATPSSGIVYGESNLTGNICEGGFLAGDQSAKFSALNSNQRSYWGF